MVFDTDKFISCIQNNPSIWEIGSKDYMDKHIRQKSWNTIGEYMFEDWSELEEHAKESKGKYSKLYFLFIILFTVDILYNIYIILSCRYKLHY